MRPHTRQPTRLPRPWDSPGKNTGGLPFPSPMHESEKGKWSRSVVSNSLWPHGLQSTRLPCPWDSPGKNTEWVATSFSNAWKWKGKVKLLSRVWLLVTPWTAAYQVPPSMGFSRQKYWSGVPSPKAMVFLVVMYGCESWTIKKAEHQKIDAFELWC